MATIETFTDIKLSELMNIANDLHSKGWRGVQILCVNTEEGIDITYTFNEDNTWANYRIKGVTKQDTVPSLQGMFLNMFPFENEAVDLFGVNVEGMVLDFAGKFYDLAQAEPMTIISPEQKAARDKAKKAAEAAAKPAKAPDASAEAKQAPVPLTDDEIEAKVAAVAPEKQEKVRAALKAKQKKDIAAAQAAKTTQDGKDGE